MVDLEWWSMSWLTDVLQNVTGEVWYPVGILEYQNVAMEVVNVNEEGVLNEVLKGVLIVVLMGITV